MGGEISQRPMAGNSHQYSINAINRNRRATSPSVLDAHQRAAMASAANFVSRAAAMRQVIFRRIKEYHFSP